MIQAGRLRRAQAAGCASTLIKMDAWRRETIETHCNSRLGIDWLWHRSAAVFAKKLYRAAKIKIDEYNAQKARSALSRRARGKPRWRCCRQATVAHKLGCASRRHRRVPPVWQHLLALQASKPGAAITPAAASAPKMSVRPAETVAAIQARVTCFAGKSNDRNCGSDGASTIPHEN